MPGPEESTYSVDGDRLTAADTHALADAQALVEKAVRAYSDLAAESSSSPAPLPENHSLTQTDVLRLVSALLETADVEVFELAMWQLWTPK